MFVYTLVIAVHTKSHLTLDSILVDPVSLKRDQQNDNAHMNAIILLNCLTFMVADASFFLDPFLVKRHSEFLKQLCMALSLKPRPED
jgi:hypothetical protein